MDVLKGLSTSKHGNKPEGLLTQILDGTTIDADGTILMSVWKEINNDYAAAKKHRWAAPSTQKRQDVHLAEYRKWMLPLLSKTNPAIILKQDAEPDAYDEYLFPSGDSHQVCDLIAKYILLAVGSMKSRARGGTPRLKGLVARRFSLMFWANRLCDLPPPKHILMNRTNASMYYAINKWDLQRPGDPKVYFGKNELVQLLDYDMSITVSVEVAEGHQLAWTLAWVCGVRPGSIGRLDMSPDRYIRWRDISITRIIDENGDIVPGGFMSQTRFVYLKQAATLDKNSPKSVVFPISTPNDPQNIPLSPVYRLLIILLRRGFLRHYSTVQELLDGKHHNITIKDSALDLPIVIRGNPRGRGLDPAGIAATALSLSAYMGKRTHMIGFPEGSTMYAWRREAGQNVSQVASLDKVRQFMAHKPNSSTFQEWYQNEVFDLDVFAIAANEKQQTRGYFSDTNSAAILRADLVSTSLQRKALVNAWVEDQPRVKGLRNSTSPDDKRELKRELRRLRDIGSKALAAAARKEYETNRTADDIAARKKELSNPSKIFTMITERAQAQAATQNEDEDMEEEDGDEDITDEDRFRDVADDVEVQIAESQGSRKSVATASNMKGTGTAILTPNDDGHNDDTISMPAVGQDEFESSVLAVELVKSFMEYMLEKRVSDPGIPRLCPLCQVDTTVTVDQKNQLWRSEAYLQRHIDGAFHNGYSKWSRRMHQLHVPGGEWFCLYGCGRHYKDLEGLVKHIKKPFDAAGNVPDHDDKKREDGWYRDDWTKTSIPESTRQSRNEYRKAKYVKDTGYVRLPSHKHLESGEYEVFMEPTVRLLDGYVVEYGRRDGFLEKLNEEIASIKPGCSRPLEDEIDIAAARYEEAKKNSEGAKSAK